MKQNILYKIYMGRKCVYVGATTVDLTATLRMHFFGKEDTLDIERVSKIEYTTLHSFADCLVYKTYYTNLIKPLYNKTDKARDEISKTVILPELNFVEYNNPIIEKWKEMLKKEQLSLFEQF
jgi:hypothetical protein